MGRTRAQARISFSGSLECAKQGEFSTEWEARQGRVKGCKPMRNQDLAILGVRILGLYALIQALQMSTQAIWMAAPEFDRRPGTALLIVVPVIGALVLAALVLRYAQSLGIRIAPEEATPGSVDSRGLQAMLLATAGILLMVTLVPRLLNVGFVLLQPDDLVPQGELGLGRLRIQFAGLLVEFCLGLTLVAGARSFAECWHRLWRIHGDG